MCAATEKRAPPRRLSRELNNLDRYQLVLDAICRIPRLAGQVSAETARFNATMQRHKRYNGEHGDDMPDILNWRWTL